MLSHSVATDSLHPQALLSMGILQAKILEWLAMPSSRGSSWSQGWNPDFPQCIWILYRLSHWGSPRILEWVACPFSRRSPWLRNWTGVSCTAGGVFIHWATRKSESDSVVSDSLWPNGLYSPWNFPGQNTGVGSCSLLQGIFPTQRLNPGLPHCRWILYQLSHKGSPR